MDIFSILTMLGGLALFLYGMHIMGEGLSKVSGGKLEAILEKLTSNPIKAVLLGAGVTAVIQSSSATTVMVVGFVNSGIMKLTQAVGIIMGANIGTTATSWILSLTGIESGNFLIKMCKPTSFSPILALLGVCFILFSKKEKKKDVGMIMVGFAILMTGMSSMSDAVKPLADVPAFTNILIMFSNPILGVIAGTVLTAVIQSSSASVGILQALCATGSLTYATAFPIIMGQNIGTCVTAMISGIGAKKNAKRAALVHLYFNMIGTIVFMGLFYAINAFVSFGFLGDVANAAGIAVIHSVFNVTATLLLLPFGKGLVKLACLTVKDDELEEEENLFEKLDDRFLDKPGFAMQQCRELTRNMAETAKKGLYLSFDLLKEYDSVKAEKVYEIETLVDQYEDQIGSYLVKLSSKNMSEEDSKELTVLLHCIGDFERISDHAVNLMQAATEMNEKGLVFSEEAVAEVEIYMNAMREIVDNAFKAFEENDLALAESIEPLEEVIDGLNVKLKKRHVIRLRDGKCTIELGFVLADITTNFERVADHCSNLAVSMLQIDKDGFDTHEYLDTLKRENNPEFIRRYEEYKEKYRLPKK
ncbi:MAG: Na/Pi cotransporter family protein [bacterium]|nr:Na/Pi cotransporter family protein [bacterium]